jgi:hypothetical protein
MAIYVTPIPILIDPSRLVPNGNVAITFFVEACPSGWSEYTGLRGRYPVGVPSGGSILGTVGTAMTNQESRAVGQHTHTFSSSALSTHTHSFSGTGHTHSFTGASHGHRARAMSNAANTTDPEDRYLADGASNYVIGSGTLVDMGVSMIPETTVAGSNAEVTQGGTNAAITAGTPAGTNANAGSVANTNAPYIQLVPCTKD